MQSGSYASWMAAGEMPDRDDDAGPVYRTLRREQRTARKRHQCDECRGIIEAGERYEIDVYTVDGEFRVLRAHIAGKCHGPYPWDDEPLPMCAECDEEPALPSTGLCLRCSEAEDEDDYDPDELDPY